MADILYDIGLCHHSVGEQTQRKTINKPIVISTAVWIYLAQRIASIMISNDNDLILICLGDVGRYWAIKVHLNAVLIICALMIIASQLNYLYGYKRGIEPKFVRLFHSLSGEDIPVTIGLHHDSHFKQVMQYKTIFRIIDKHNQFFFPIFASLFNFISYFINENITNVIIYGIPNSLYLGLFAYYFSNIMIFQFAYFYYLCKYLRIKLKNLNTELYSVQFLKTNVSQEITQFFAHSTPSTVRSTNTTQLIGRNFC